MEMPWADGVTNMAEEKYREIDGCRDVLWMNLWKDGLGKTSVPL